jgi:hypothetical protein
LYVYSAGTRGAGLGCVSRCMGIGVYVAGE